MVVTQHQSGFLRCFPNALKLFPQTGATSQQIRFYIIPFKLLCPVIPSAGSHILGATFYRQPAEYRPQVIIKREHNFRIFPCTDYHHVSRTSMQQNPAKIILAYNPYFTPVRKQPNLRSLFLNLFLTFPSFSARIKSELKTRLRENQICTE